MTISSRLDQAMQAAGIVSQSALARASGIPQPTINRILKGSGKKGPEMNTLITLAEACNVATQWLMDGTGPMERTPPAEPEGELVKVSFDDEEGDFVGVRMVARYIHAGVNGADGDLEFEEDTMLSVRRSWVIEKGLPAGALVAIRVIGDSMYPTLKRGNVVIVNTADKEKHKLIDGAMYAVNHNGKPCVKRLELNGGTWFLASDNKQPEFRSRAVDESTEVLGRVVRMEADFI
jgi:phage repressor protein C with HTH and peptisase S24 domain